MCGITGFSGSYNPQLLKKMGAAIAHRGPDGVGEWYDPKGSVGLAHRRLSILDLSNAAAQPMSACFGRYMVCFNGEIYNFKTFHKVLDKHGYDYNKNSDTSILAPLYDLYGVDMLNKLNGIFSFALYDLKFQELFLARDHAGIKPLYYYKEEKNIAFSSEIKSLVNIPNFKNELDNNAILDYLTYLWSPGERTPFKHVKKLLPGHFMKVKDGKCVIKQWYEAPLPKVKSGTPQYDYVKSSDDLLHLFDEVVSDQCLSDVDVSAFLSGGVDSSAIVSSMVHTGHKPKETYCMAFKNSAMADEGFTEDIIYARKVAKHLDVSLNEVIVDETCLDNLPNMVKWLDEPQADPAPLYVNAISQAAANQNTKVLLGGTAGDDVFSGYRRHQAVMMREKFSANINTLLKYVLPFAAKISPEVKGIKRRLQKLAKMYQYDENEFLYRAFEFTPREDVLKMILETPECIGELKCAKSLKNALKRSEEQNPLNKLLLAEFSGFLPDHNLNYTDKAGMAAGVEIRVPFLDKRIIDFAHDLPIEQKIHGSETKYILKKAMESRLPHDVLYRSKAGFGAPLRGWLQGPLKPMVRDILFTENAKIRDILNIEEVKNLVEKSENNQIDGAYTVFACMVLELWLQAFYSTKA